TIFELEWLWQICFSSTIATAVALQVPISEAIQAYRKQRKEISIRTLDVIFNITQVAESTDSEENDIAKLSKKLLDHIDNDELMDVLMDKLDVLYKDISKDEVFHLWLQDRFKAT